MAAGPTDALRVYEVATAVYGLPELWDRDRRPVDAGHRAEPDRAAVPATAGPGRPLAAGPPPAAVGRPAEIARYQPVVAELSRSMPRLLCGSEFARVHADAADLRAQGIPADLALQTGLRAVHVQPARHHRRRRRDGPGAGRGGRALLRAQRAHRAGPDPVLGVGAGPRRPLALAGPAGHPGRPLQLGAGDHRRCAVHHDGRPGRRGQDRSVGGGESVPPGARPDHPRSDRRLPGWATWPRCRWPPARSVRWPDDRWRPGRDRRNPPDAPQRYVTDVRVRYSDLDAQGHVNNARVITLLEEARVDWLYADAPGTAPTSWCGRSSWRRWRSSTGGRSRSARRPGCRSGSPRSAARRSPWTTWSPPTAWSSATASTVLVVVEPADGRPRRLGRRRASVPRRATGRPTRRVSSRLPGRSPTTPRPRPSAPGYAAWSR